MTNLAAIGSQLTTVNQMPRKSARPKQKRIDTEPAASLLALLDRPHQDSSLLHTAIKAGHLQIVTFLLDKVSPDSVYMDEPAVCLAARLNHCEILSLLAKHGAKIAVSDAAKQTPLSYAISNECSKCLTVLFEHLQK